jgi:hypothetical protein
MNCTRSLYRSLISICSLPEQAEFHQQVLDRLEEDYKNMESPSIPECRVLVTGSRDWKDKEQVEIELRDVENDFSGPFRFVLIHGACTTGADKMADNWCIGKSNWTVRKHAANWNKYGNAAGPLRNTQMLDKESPTVILAFNLHRSKGTTHMVRLAQRRLKQNRLPNLKKFIEWVDDELVDHMAL